MALLFIYSWVRKIYENSIEAFYRGPHCVIALWAYLPYWIFVGPFISLNIYFLLINWPNKSFRYIKVLPLKWLSSLLHSISGHWSRVMSVKYQVLWLAHCYGWSETTSSLRTSYCMGLGAMRKNFYNYS